MSEQNVEVVRGIYEAANRRDFDAAVKALAPDIEIHLAGLFPDMERVHRGPGVLLKLAEPAEAWEEISIDPDRIIDLGARVLVLAHFQAKGREGIEVARPIAHLWMMRNGLAVRMDAYSDQQEALEAVGLSE